MEGSVLATVSEYIRDAISAPGLLLRESDRQQSTPSYERSQKARSICSHATKNAFCSASCIYTIKKRFLFGSDLR